MLHSEQSDGEACDTTADPSREGLEMFAASAEGRLVRDLESRLAGDIELATRLMFAGYDGLEWIEVANRLAAYGLRVMLAWILDGTVAAHCKGRSLAGPWSMRCRDRVEADSLASDTVSTALMHFRDDVLKPGRWSADRGASLSTYFIGQCLIRWSNVFWAWERSNRRVQLTDGSDVDRLMQSDGTSQVLDRLQAEAILDHYPPLVGRVIRLRSEGYAWEEIAELTGNSVGRIRGLLARFHQNMNGVRKVAK
jgi:hypothetical protein